MASVELLFHKSQYSLFDDKNMKLRQIERPSSTLSFNSIIEECLSIHLITGEATASTL